MVGTKRSDEQTDQVSKRRDAASDDARSAELRDSPMMAHLMDALEKGTDIGHYGRLVFAMVARHFLDEDELVRLLGNQPDHNADEARALLRQVEAKDYTEARAHPRMAGTAGFPDLPNTGRPDKLQYL